MSKDQIDKLKEIQAYLNYLIGDLTLKGQYKYADDVFTAAVSINEITATYKDLRMGR